MIVNVIVMQ